MTSDQLVVTRFAPSPTGHLHIGGARTALFCWAYAKKTGGRFLIRIEDTDQARSSEASARGILEDLAWLGIEWDEGPELPVAGRASPIGGDPRHVAPFYQSQRLAIYNEVLDGMMGRGVAYADFTPAETIERARKASSGKNETFKYRPADSEILPLAEQKRRMAAGESHVIRLRAPQEGIRVVDEVLGEVAFAAGEVDDLVLRKADGYPTYHFGVVVDDEMMGVTHVLRGQEHLMNTPRHAAIQRVLGYRTPVYAHMPLIFNDQGAKMSKRERDATARDAVRKAGLTASPITAIDDAAFTGWLADKKRQLETGQLESLADHLHLTLPEVSVEDFRKAGYLPEVICNFIALLGWNPGMKNADGTDLEKFDMEFLARRFDLPAIGKSNSRFDRKKLASFNGDAINAMTDAEFAARWLAWCERFDPATARQLAAMGTERAAWLARAVKPRCKTLRDAMKPAQFVFTPDDAIAYDPAAVKKHLEAPVVASGVVSPGQTPPAPLGLSTGRDILRALKKVLETLHPWTPEVIHAGIEQFSKDHGLGMGQVAQPIRVALTGTGVSPGLGEALAVVGKTSTLARIGRCLERRA
ncbi:MAG: glutamate--tRNA ligase [Phycisphaerae bacterium]|nr:glutamate--tRNA ligase [Phycisphaerae bacterium]